MHDLQGDSTVKYKPHSSAVKELSYNTDGSVLASVGSNKIILKKCKDHVSFCFIAFFTFSMLFTQYM